MNFTQLGHSSVSSSCSSDASKMRMRSASPIGMPVSGQRPSRLTAARAHAAQKTKPEGAAVGSCGGMRHTPQRSGGGSTTWGSNGGSGGGGGMSFGGGGGWCSGACQNSSSWYLTKDGTQMALRWHSDGTQMALRWHLPKDGQDQQLTCVAQRHLSKRSHLVERR